MDLAMNFLNRRNDSQFHPFSRLPTDLRLQIWNLILAEPSPPIIFDITCRSVSSSYPTGWGTPKLQKRFPPILIQRINRESYLLALAYYTRGFNLDRTWRLPCHHYNPWPQLYCVDGHEIEGLVSKSVRVLGGLGQQGWSQVAIMPCTHCSVPPIIASGMFILDLEAHNFRADPKIVYMVPGFLCLYLLALPFARPDAGYAAGRGLWNIIDMVSLCYDSPLLQCREFSAQRVTDEETHLKCRVILQKRRYQFGYYKGISGHHRLGFSTPDNTYCPMDGFPDRAAGEVDKIKIRYRFLRFNRFPWFRTPAIIPRRPQRVDTETEVGDTHTMDRDHNTDIDRASHSTMIENTDEIELSTVSRRSTFGQDLR